MNEDILRIIVTMCDARTLATLMRVCKQYNTVVQRMGFRKGVYKRFSENAYEDIKHLTDLPLDWNIAFSHACKNTDAKVVAHIFMEKLRCNRPGIDLDTAYKNAFASGNSIAIMLIAAMGFEYMANALKEVNSCGCHDVEVIE